MKILHAVGARPNFVKIAPLVAEIARRPERFSQVLVHTGQHYDVGMSDVFFEQLRIPNPDYCLNVGPGTHAEQTARIMLAFEPVLRDEKPDWLIVVGDVNSTLACALVAAKRGVRVAHVEAGLRSRDRTMPEETNRIVTDHLSDLLFTPSLDANANLQREGIDPCKIHFVGNVMIDSLQLMLPSALKSNVLTELGLLPKAYAFATIHRPSNVDDPLVLGGILSAFSELAATLPLVFPLHPRTRKAIAQLGGLVPDSAIRFVEPLDYVSSLAIINSARLVLTDSGGIQEETAYLGVPCLTIRPNTERPITIECGTNRLVPSTREAILQTARAVLADGTQPRKIPDLWDGRTSQRIVDVLADWTPDA